MKIKPYLLLLTGILLSFSLDIPAQHLSDAAKKLQCDIIIDAF